MTSIIIANLAIADFILCTVVNGFSILGKYIYILFNLL